MPAVSSQQPRLAPKMRNSSVTTVVDFYSIVPFLQPFLLDFEGQEEHEISPTENSIYMLDILVCSKSMFTF